MLVVDASVAIKWLIEEPASDKARRLLGRNDRLIAPELIVAEIANACWRRHVAGEITLDHATHVVEAAPQLLDALLPIADLAARAVAMAATMKHPAYDCFYLALAEREGAPLVTADSRLLARLAGTPWGALASSLADVEA